MNELQIALIAAGGLVVAAVWAYNLWQERRHKQAAEKIFKGDQVDVLLGGQATDDARDSRRVEPSSPPTGDERIEPAMSASIDDDEPAGPPPPAEWADAIADCTLRMDFTQAVAAPELWAAQAVWAGSLAKPLTWQGWDEAAGQWRRLSAHDAGRYVHVAVSLQLADRQGPVGANDLDNFLGGAHAVAQKFSGRVELPQRQDILDHATALDGFCASVDVQLGVNVVESAGGDFPGTKLRGLAEAAGLGLQADGRFHAVDERGEDLFTLGNLGAELFDADTLRTLTTHGLSLMLDVPRVADGPAAFDRMVGAARQMAQALGGTLVDGQRHPLTDHMIAGIRSKIGEIQQQMDANQIPPGSPRALRLFS